MDVRRDVMVGADAGEGACVAPVFDGKLFQAVLEGSHLRSHVLQF